MEYFITNLQIPLDIIVEMTHKWLVCRREDAAIRTMSDGASVITTMRDSDSSLTNTVGIRENNIYVNRVSDRNGIDITKELYEYINNIPSIIRENKINKILK